MIEHIKRMKIPYLDLWSMLLSGQNASQEQFKSLVLESQRSCASSNTALQGENKLPPITYWLFHKLIQDVGHNMLHLDMQLNSCHHCNLSSYTPLSYLLPMTADGELNSQFPSAIVLNKKLPDLFKLRTKVEKPDIHFSQQT